MKKSTVHCKWIYDDDCGAWRTECGGLFVLMEGTPEENKMKFCPYCGKQINCHRTKAYKEKR